MSGQTEESLPVLLSFNIESLTAKVVLGYIEHESKECVALGEAVVCVNCRGTHGDQKSPVRERQVEVSRLRVVQKLSYAEAVKKVAEDRARDPERSGVSSRSVPEQGNRPTSDICFSKI